MAAPAAGKSGVAAPPAAVAAAAAAADSRATTASTDGEGDKGSGDKASDKKKRPPFQPQEDSENLLHTVIESIEAGETTYAHLPEIPTRFFGPHRSPEMIGLLTSLHAYIEALVETPAAGFPPAGLGGVSGSGSGASSVSTFDAFSAPSAAEHPTEALASLRTGVSRAYSSVLMLIRSFISFDRIREEEAFWEFVMAFTMELMRQAFDEDLRTSIDRLLAVIFRGPVFCGTALGRQVAEKAEDVDDAATAARKAKVAAMRQTEEEKRAAAQERRHQPRAQGGISTYKYSTHAPKSPRYGQDRIVTGIKAVDPLKTTRGLEEGSEAFEVALAATSPKSRKKAKKAQSGVPLTRREIEEQEEQEAKDAISRRKAARSPDYTHFKPQSLGMTSPRILRRDKALAPQFSVFGAAQVRSPAASVLHAHQGDSADHYDAMGSTTLASVRHAARAPGHPTAGGMSIHAIRVRAWAVAAPGASLANVENLVQQKVSDRIASRRGSSSTSSSRPGSRPPKGESPRSRMATRKASMRAPPAGGRGAA